MQRGDKVVMAANLLLEVSREVQLQTKGDFQRDEFYAREFCTIRVGSSRRSGHDFAAARIIRDNFKAVLYVSPNQAMQTIAERENVQALRGLLAKNRVSPHQVDVVYATIGNIDNSRYDGLRFDAVIMNPGTYFQKHSFDVYKRTLPMMLPNEFMHWIYIG